MSVVDNNLRVRAHVALTLRLVAIGKSLDMLSPEDISEVLDCVVADSKRVHIDLKAYMEHLVVLDSNGELVLNF